MAAPVASGSAYISDLVSLLAPQHGRLSYAARLALICTLTVLVVEIYQTPEPALATYIVFFLNRDSRTQSLILNVVLTLLITIIIAVVIMVARLVLDDGMWRVISMALISFGLLFLTSASKLRPLGSTIALIIGYALDELGLIQIGELGTRALLYAWLFVGIPAGVSMVCEFAAGASATAARRTGNRTTPRACGGHAGNPRRDGSQEFSRMFARRYAGDHGVAGVGEPREDLTST
jgi:multidrug resistance protein MdtO